MARKRFQWTLRRETSPGRRIVLAVSVILFLLVVLSIPLIRGLAQNAHMQATVSEQMVPDSIMVTALVSNTLDVQSALEAFLFTGNVAEQERYKSSLEIVRLSFNEFAARQARQADSPAPSKNAPTDDLENASTVRLVSGAKTLIDKLSQQAEEVFIIRSRPDNFHSAHLINTRGQQLAGKSARYMDKLMERWLAKDTAADPMVLSALWGYQDSLGALMSNLRGYLFNQEPRYREAFVAQQQRNEGIFQLLTFTFESAGPAFKELHGELTRNRAELFDVFDEAFASRDAEDWRRDLYFYQTEIAPTLESIKWVLSTLSDGTSQGISSTTTESAEFGDALRKRSLAGLALVLALTGAMGFWIYRSVGVFNRQIGVASGALDELSAQMREETAEQARETGTQVEHIDKVSNTILEFQAALTGIRGQTEEMARQTDSASLECVQGLEVLRGSQGRMDAILKQAREISQAMEDTRHQTEMMDGILAILNELVDQTKLLSFNATIESAGAGESGARFAVVAKQVRRLANRSQVATQEIRDMIKRVQQAVEDTQGATERGKGAVNEGADLMTMVTERLDAIVGAVSHVSDMAGSIFLSAQEQSDAVSGVDAFVDEAKEVAENVSKRSEEALITAADLSKTAENLSKLVGK
ncbi:MAG: methyl-accepting chemotaxis protein [Leptospirillia bacterium]